METNENDENDKNNGSSDNNDADKNNGSNDNHDNKDNKAESVLIHYGWDTDDEDYVAKIYCPRGAKFSEDTLENQKRDGWVLSANLDDEVNEYVAMSNCYWHRDAYSEEPFEYSIVAQLYFDGEIDAKSTVLTDPDYMHFSFFGEDAGGGLPRFITNLMEMKCIGLRLIYMVK